MSNSYIDQITLDCLLNKDIMGNHVMKQREKQINKEEFEFYKKRIYNLFEQLISNQKPDDLPPDVKYAYDTFLKSSIHYFKVADNNDLLQEEYKYIVMEEENELPGIEEVSNCDDANKLMMRSVKMDVTTLDKYVKKIPRKKESTANVFLPKSREVDINQPELKNKGLKKNIHNLYEDHK